MKKEIGHCRSNSNIPKMNSNESCKEISYQLISQIHFCRFAYKLLSRMTNLKIGTVTGRTKCNVKGLIFKKLNDV